MWVYNTRLYPYKGKSTTSSHVIKDVIYLVTAVLFCNKFHNKEILATQLAS